MRLSGCTNCDKSIFSSFLITSPSCLLPQREALVFFCQSFAVGCGRVLLSSNGLWQQSILCRLNPHPFAPSLSKNYDKANAYPPGRRSNSSTKPSGCFALQYTQTVLSQGTKITWVRSVEEGISAALLSPSNAPSCFTLDSESSHWVVTSSVCSVCYVLRLPKALLTSGKPWVLIQILFLLRKEGPEDSHAFFTGWRHPRKARSIVAFSFRLFHDKPYGRF